MWLVREEVRIEYAEEVRKIDIKKEGTSLSLQCPSKKIFRRGDTLNLPVITVVCMKFPPTDKSRMQLLICLHRTSNMSVTM